MSQHTAETDTKRRMQEVTLLYHVSQILDKSLDMREVVSGLRAIHVTPHVAQYPTTRTRRSAIDGRTTRQPGYAISQRMRKRVEEIFGWMKTVGLLRKLRHRGGPTVGWIFTFTAAVYNLVRLRSLSAQAA